MSSDNDVPTPGFSRIRAIVTGSIGNLVEWYDWYVYAAFALYFSRAFFPGGDTTAQLLNTAGVFALGFLMRPVGGWFLGRYADRRGRKAALTLSVTLMCSGSLMIAVAPTYADAGILGPIVLVVARLVQGFSVGGEYGASATYLSEMASRGHRGFYSSFQYVTLIMGQLLALGLLVLLQQVLLTTEQLETWGWRIPFAIGAVCALVALYLRRQLPETEAFLESAAPRNPGLTLLRYPRQLFTVVALTMGGTLAYYTYATYMQKFLSNTAGLSRADATLINAGTLFIFMLMHPVIGALSDRIGRRPVLLTFGILGTLGTVPLMTAIGASRDPTTIFWLVLAALMIVSCYTSVNAIVKAELFPAEIRALGVGLPYAVTVSVFGGTAEYLALWFKQAGHESWFYWYVSAGIGLSLCAYATMPDTWRTSMLDREEDRRG